MCLGMYGCVAFASLLILRGITMVFGCTKGCMGRLYIATLHIIVQIERGALHVDMGLKDAVVHFAYI